MTLGTSPFTPSSKTVELQPICVPGLEVPSWVLGSMPLKPATYGCTVGGI
jgi:hypothetical protein